VIFVAGTGLLSKQGKNVLSILWVNSATLWFQLHGYFACNHVNLLGCHGKGPVSDTALVQSI